MSIEDAISLHQQGQLDEARALYEAALQANPRDPLAMRLLGTLCLQQGAVYEAVSRLRASLALDPSPAEGWEHLGQAQRVMGDVEEAADSLRNALEREPDRGNAWANYCLVLVELGELGRAVHAGQTAVQHAPELADAHTNLGLAYKELGRIDESEASYRLGIALDRRNVFAWGGLAELHTIQAGDPSIDALDRLFHGGELGPYEVEVAGFALGRFREDTGAYERAFLAYQAANEARRLRMPPFDRAALARRFAAIGALSDLTPIGDAGEAPIFVVGFPRTGTTLVESILAEHRDVVGAGELPFMPAAVERMGLRIDPAQVAATRSPYERLAGRRIADKMPHNFEHLWLIARLFPDATIVHCKRDRRDALVSVYAQDFASEHAYKHDLDDLRFAWDRYQELMEHWRRVLPIPMHEVEYEALVAQPRPHVEALLKAVDLDWQEACMHPGQGYQRTADAHRRAGFTTASVGRYKRFEPWIGPLL